MYRRDISHITDAQRRAREWRQESRGDAARGSEIASFAPLDDRQLVESDAWFEFAMRFKLSCCNWAFKRRRSWSASARRHMSRMTVRVQLDIAEASAEVQCNVYALLDAAKKRITKSKGMSLRILTEICAARTTKSARAPPAATKHMYSERMALADPHSDQAVEAKRSRLQEQELCRRGKAQWTCERRSRT